MDTILCNAKDFVLQEYNLLCNFAQYKKRKYKMFQYNARVMFLFLQQCIIIVLC